MTEAPLLFHKTVIGSSHIQEGTVCQDSSLSFCDKENRYQILCVSDGHGSSACPRSDRGSQFAVTITLESVKAFAEAIINGEMQFDTPRQQASCIEQLTNTILSQWRNVIEKDVAQEPLTEAELDRADQYKEAYLRGERLEHLYGATLICALRVGDIFILFQQGDGRCDVFYADGTVNQPIPWDERCHGTTTTSLCDLDAYGRIRSTVINCVNTPVAACFLGSDGIEDSYYENEETQLGTHRFFMELICKSHELSPEDLDVFLEQRLSELSRTGSRDDMSVSGMVDLEATAPLLEHYASEIERIDQFIGTKKKYDETRLKVISMSRKHGILSERLAKAKEDYSKFIETPQNQLEALKSEREKLSVELNQAEEAIRTNQSETAAAINEARENEKKFSSRLKNAFLSFYDALNDEEKKCQIERSEIAFRIEAVDNRIQELERQIRSNQARADELESAQAQFDEYDAEYTRYTQRLAQMERMIRSVIGENG